MLNFTNKYMGMLNFFQVNRIFVEKWENTKKYNRKIFNKKPKNQIELSTMLLEINENITMKKKSE